MSTISAVMHNKKLLNAAKRKKRSGKNESNLVISYLAAGFQNNREIIWRTSEYTRKDTML